MKYDAVKASTSAVELDEAMPRRRNGQDCGRSRSYKPCVASRTLAKPSAKPRMARAPTSPCTPAVATG